MIRRIMRPLSSQLLANYRIVSENSYALSYYMIIVSEVPIILHEDMSLTLRLI